MSSEEPAAESITDEQVEQTADDAQDTENVDKQPEQTEEAEAPAEEVAEEVEAEEGSQDVEQSEPPAGQEGTEQAGEAEEEPAAEAEQGTAEDSEEKADEETAEAPQEDASQAAEGEEVGEEASQAAADTEVSEEQAEQEQDGEATEEAKPDEDKVEDATAEGDVESSQVEAEEGQDAGTAEEEKPAEAEDSATAEAVEEPSAEADQEPAAEKTEEVAAEQTEKPAAEQTEEVAAEQTGEVATEQTEEVAAEQTEEANAEQTEEPAAEQTEEVAAEQTEEPAAEPTQETTEEIAESWRLNMRRIPDAPPLPQKPMTREPTQMNLEPGPDALNLMWSFGVNERIPVLNITDGNRKMIMYTSGHTGILYDMVNINQKLLQGHSNNITCTCVSRDKRWLATGDKGLDNTVIIWDTTTGFPVRTMFEPYPEGIVAIAITPDAKYLATLSAGDPQVLAIWDWTTGDEEPLHTAQLDSSYGLQNYLHFNPDDTSQLVSNSDHQVVFYSWTDSSFEYFAPPLTDQDFNKPVGRYSQTIYLRNSTRALTATSLGNMVVWDSNKPLTIVGTEPTPDKRALKLVKLQDTAIKVLTTTDDYIVMGDAQGHVRFLDDTLKLINWYQDIDLGPISAISFAHVPEFQPIAKEGSEFPNDATIPSRKFVVKDFAVGTTSAVLAYVTADGSTVDVIHRDHDAPVYALDTHPTEPKFCVGSYSGLLKVWDYEFKEALVSRYFDKGQMIRCCAYDPKGDYIAVGFMNGTLRIVDSITLKDELQEPYRYSREAITHCAFSHDSQFLATADAEFAITLYRSSPQSPDGWEYMGRRRPHYKLIVDMLFTVHLDSNLPRLLTLGQDRMLVEYDLALSEQDNIVIANTDRIEQSATGMCLAMYPSITKEQFILTANDQYKFKLYNSTTKMCRKTLLGPTYGSALQKIVVLPTDNPHSDPRYMTYITADKVGITKMPLTGNPHDAMALIAHPSGVTNLVTSYDGRFVFTAGGSDSIVHMWSTNFDVLEAQAKLGGDDLIPFYGLLDGGRDGELFAELEDYFYYAQIRSQGVDTMDTRTVSTKIPLSQVPFVMRAMGFYPSEQEVLDMINEVKYGQYVETGKYVEDIDLGTFIKLYVNHRPAFGLDPEELNWVFQALGDSKSDENEDQMDRGYLLDILQSKGEHMTEYELAEYITTLLGYTKEGGSCELQDFDPSMSADIITENLPIDLTARAFADKVLGFPMTSDILTLEQESTFA